MQQVVFHVSGSCGDFSDPGTRRTAVQPQFVALAVGPHELAQHPKPSVGENRVQLALQLLARVAFDRTDFEPDPYRAAQALSATREHETFGALDVHMNQVDPRDGAV